MLMVLTMFKHEWQYKLSHTSSRIENHAEDIKLSTLERVAKALGKQLQVNIE